MGRHLNLGRSPQNDAILSKAGIEIEKGDKLWAIWPLLFTLFCNWWISVFKLNHFFKFHPQTFNPYLGKKLVLRNEVRWTLYRTLVVKSRDSLKRKIEFESCIVRQKKRKNKSTKREGFLQSIGVTSKRQDDLEENELGVNYF